MLILAYPDYPKHTTLFDWLKSIPAGGDKTTRLARIFSAIRTEAILSNGLMMLIYGPRAWGFSMNRIPRSSTYYSAPWDEALLGAT
jgi:hypothetical protein